MPHDMTAIEVHMTGATVAGKMVRWNRTEIPHGFHLLGDVVFPSGGGLLLRSDQSGRFMCWDGTVLIDLPQDRTRVAIERSIPEVLKRAPPPKPLPPRVEASIRAAVRGGNNRNGRHRYT